ncbi:MAG: tRNA (adenosine(37)-N6)-threonylcarbamoyltransferase complex dimerization subunit type 1 TsaB [Phycisphaerae bacterium]|nr:tRNA (adenosine(37)-N6)-threonylcarbamoyltransferase complex dimerization subunit type 1 TsaB [Phycisphaerae bacterium]
MSPTGPLTLAIEASNPGPHSPAMGPQLPRVSVCLGRPRPGSAAEVLGFESVPTDRRDDEGLIPAVDRLVRGAGKGPRDLRRVAVSIGPGGFTGLRLAVAFAKMVCEVTGAECVAVPTAHALIRRVDAALRAERPGMILLAWKRDDVWAERFDAGDSIHPASPGALTPIRALQPRPNEIIVCDAELEATMRTLGLVPPGAAMVRPRFDASAVLEASDCITPIDPIALSPLYPREPEAATKWRELKKRGK